MIDWSRTSLTETAEGIAGGRTSARDVLEACLDRIGALNPRLNCFIEVDEAGARAAADNADRMQRAGAALGPLHGVPLAHKDMYYRAGRVSACGSKLRADWRAPYTATVLQRLDAAGALDIGRLAMVEFAMGPHGYNQNYPFCGNPWNSGLHSVRLVERLGCRDRRAHGAWLARLGYGRLDPLPGCRERCRRARSYERPRQSPWRDADVALLRCRWSARADGA